MASAPLWDRFARVLWKRMGFAGFSWEYALERERKFLAGEGSSDVLFPGPAFCALVAHTRSLAQELFAETVLASLADHAEAMEATPVVKRPKARQTTKDRVAGGLLAESPEAIEAAEEALLALLHRAATGATKGDRLILWCDGSGTTADGPCGGGCVYEFHGERHGFGIALGRGTNNVGELGAIYQAVRYLLDRPVLSLGVPLTVRSDSEYALGACAGNQAIANRELVLELRATLRRFSSVLLEHVPGHSGIVGNELADRLAKAAAKLEQGTRVWLAPGRA